MGKAFKAAGRRNSRHMQKVTRKMCFFKCITCDKTFKKPKCLRDHCKTTGHLCPDAEDLEAGQKAMKELKQTFKKSHMPGQSTENWLQSNVYLDAETDAQLDEWVRALRAGEFATADIIRMDLRSRGVDPAVFRSRPNHRARGNLCHSGSALNVTEPESGEHDLESETLDGEGDDLEDIQADDIEGEKEEEDDDGHGEGDSEGGSTYSDAVSAQPSAIASTRPRPSVAPCTSSCSGGQGDRPVPTKAPRYHQVFEQSGCGGRGKGASFFGLGKGKRGCGGCEDSVPFAGHSGSGKGPFGYGKDFGCGKGKSKDEFMEFAWELWNQGFNNQRSAGYGRGMKGSGGDYGGVKGEGGGGAKSRGKHI